MLATTTATSQSTVSNNQVDAGDICSSQQFDVVSNSSDTSATSTADSSVGSASSGLAVQSTQGNSGDVAAYATMNWRDARRAAPDGNRPRRRS